MGEPDARWLFEIAGPLVFLAFAGYFAVDTYRHRWLSFGAVILIAFTTMWWQEWYGDWGAYILYNPEFERLPWHTTQWTTPNKPWAVIPAYGWFYAVLFLGGIAAIRKVRERWSGVPFWFSMFIVVVPFLYVWDLIVEGGASQLGWWSYVDFVGPAIEGPKGNFPLLYPILLFCLFAYVMMLVLLWRDDRGRPRVELSAGVYSVRVGWRQDLARVAVWILAANLTYAITLIGPVIAIRELAGDPSTLVP